MCHGSDLCERFFRDLTKGVETSSPVCFSDECMGAGCVCCKWKAPHLCLYGTQICLIKSGGYPSHCLSSWNKYAPIHYHHRQLATLHRLFFFFSSSLPHQKGCLYCLSQHLCLLLIYWLPSPLCRTFAFFTGSLEKMFSDLLCFSECQFPAQCEPRRELHPFTSLAYGFASSSGRIICSSCHAS